MKTVLISLTLFLCSQFLFAQVSKTVYLANAGTLSAELTTEELNTITDLTITGDIDARDFVIMRDSMPLLAEIDLSGVTIDEYNGTEGTSIFVSFYPGNSIPDYAFYNTTTHKELVNIKTFVFPENVEAIGNNAFRFCSGISSFSIPESVISIGTQAFQNCDGIVSLNLPQNLTSINGSAFSTCKNLETVNFSDHLYSIGESAFAWCQKLITIKIPATVTSIGTGAFLNCTALSSIYADPQTPPEESISANGPFDFFYGVNKSVCTLYVSVGSESKYTSARYWEDFQNIVEMEPVDLDSGLVAYYPFNGNVNDESGNGNDGTIEGATLTTDRFGNIGKAYNFDGITDKINTKINSGFNDQISICAWIKTTSDIAWAGIVLNRNNCDTVTGLLYQDNGQKISFDVFDKSGYHNVDGNINVSTGSWHLITGISNGSKSSIYIDGILDRETQHPISEIDLAGEFIIGYDTCSGYGENRHFRGDIDDVRLYNRALTPAEIDSLYHERGWPAKETPQNIKMYYVKGANSPYSIFSANIDGTEEKLLASGVEIGNAGFGGGKICYKSGSGISLVNLDGTGNMIVPNTSDAYGEADISPDGSKIVYNGSANNFILSVINIDGTGKFTFNDGNSMSNHQNYPSWNESGKIYFGQSAYGDPYSQKIYSKQVDDFSSSPVLLTSTFAQYPVAGGPDNMVAYNDQPGNLFLINSDGSGQLQFTAAGSGCYARGTWENIDSTLYYIKDGNIWKIRTNNTQNSQVTSIGNIVSVLGISSENNPINLNSGLLAYYPFNGNTLDESGNGNDGNIVGETNFQAGVSDLAVHFRGNQMGDYIEILSNNVDTLSQITISSWVNISEFDLNCWMGIEGILTRDDANSVNHFALQVIRNFESDCGSATSLDSIGFRLTYTNNVWVETKKVFIPNKWYYVTGTYDGSILKIFVDGVLVNESLPQPGLLVMGNAPMWLNSHYYWGGNTQGRMGGLIDELRLYDRALNEVEIDSLFMQGATVNYAPTANAGPDQTVNEGSVVTIDGSLSSDPEGKPLIYYWKAPCGITLNSFTSASPSFTAPKVSSNSSLTFTLIVNNGETDSKEDQVVINLTDIEVEPIEPPPTEVPVYCFPIANAGSDQLVKKGSIAVLDGTSSAFCNEWVGEYYNLHLYYYWTAPEGIDLNSCYSANPTFTVPDVLVGTSFTISLIVSDGCSFSDTDKVTITLIENHPPVANAGSDQIVDEGTTVILDGSASFDADGDTLIYTWNAISKNVNLTSTNTAQTSFIAPDVESGAGYLVSLTVSDGFLTSNPDTIMILVYNVESKANVDIYKTTVTPIIDGFEDDIWNIVAAVPIAKNFGSESPTVEAYWKAMWTDSGLYVLINVNDDNHWPSWESGGSQWEYDWSEIFLDVNDTLVDGLGFGNYNSGHYAVNVDYEENQYGSLIEYFGFTSYRLTGENLVREQFIPFSLMSDKNGTIIDKNRILELKEIGFDITIDDQDEGITTSRHRKVWQSSAIDNDCYYSMDGAGTITFKEENLNQSPIANAGPDQVVEEGAAVTLDGTLSYDIEGDSLIYVWTAPFGIDLSDASSPKPSFTAPEVIISTTYIFTLTVNDGNSTSVADSVSITVFTDPCPQHYHTVWEGTMGFDHMNINVIGAKYDGMDLESGDEIGVFDGDICVGYGKVTGTIGLQNILSIKVSRDDGTGNGFTSGNEVTYRIWNCSDSAEYAVQEVTCYDTELNPITCSPFEAGGTSFVELSGKGEECFTLEFRTGWNLFSVPVLIDSTNMMYVFQPMIDSKSLVKIQDELGNSLENWGIFGGWQNNIGEIGLTEGYKIKVNWLDSIHVCGQRVKYPYAIALQTGWNIIGYPQSGMYDAQAVTQQLIDRNTLLKVQDELGNSLENWGIFGGWQNNIGNLLPGEGYKVKVSAQDTLWIYESYTKSGTIQPELLASTHFRQNYAGNGVDHMNINLVGLPINAIQTGDELAVFEGETCVGAVTLTQHNIENQAVQLTASAFDGQAAGGFTEGRQFTLKLWSLATGAEYTIKPEILSGSATFAKHETTVASLEKYAVTGFDEIAGLEGTAVRCYPNPFSESVTIEINLSVEAEVEVEVLNQLGQVVSQLIPNQRRAAGIHQLVWNGRNPQGQQVTPGMYHLRVRMNESVLHRKVIFSK